MDFGQTPFKVAVGEDKIRSIFVTNSDWMFTTFTLKNTVLLLFIKVIVSKCLYTARVAAPPLPSLAESNRRQVFRPLNSEHSREVVSTVVIKSLFGSGGFPATCASSCPHPIRWSLSSLDIFSDEDFASVKLSQGRWTFSKTTEFFFTFLL